MLLAHLYFSTLSYCISKYADRLIYFFNSSSTREEKEFANSVDLDDVAHNELPPLDLHCLPSSL